MNILFLPSDNDQASGAFRSMVSLAEHLRNNHSCNSLVVLSRKGNGEKLLMDKNIEYVHIRSYNWIVTKASEFTLKTKLVFAIKQILNEFAINRIAKQIKRRKIDIVHNNTTWTYVGAKAAKRTGIPLVWHIREFLEEDQGVSIYNRNKGYALLRRANALIAISNSIRQKYSQILGSNNIYTILNGIDESNYLNSNHELFSDDLCRILIIGTITESKGQYQVIEALGILKGQTSHPFFLKIVGKGEKEYVEKLKIRINELGLDDRVEFCGFQQDATEFYNWADIVCVCSRAEAFGRVTVEAMLSGVLVIGANCGATSELITDGTTGYLYKYNDFHGLSDVILKSINNQDKAAFISKKGRQYANDYLTAASNASKIYDLYKSLVR